MATGASTLLLDEYLQTADPRLLPAMLASTQEPALRSIMERLLKDPRPYARTVLLDYVAQGLDRPGHRSAVKRLIKTALANKDDGLLVPLTFAVDHLTRRTLKVQQRYDWETRETSPVVLLKKADAGFPFASGYGERDTSPKRLAALPARRFSVVTRMHLCRRVLRHWKTLGRTDHARFRTGVVDVLSRYEDVDVATPEQLLDAWNLLHLMYGASDVVDHRSRGALVRAGNYLKDLAFAPLFRKAWADSAAAPDLLALLQRARCRPVRRFALTLLQAHHKAALDALPLETLLQLLESEDDAVAGLAAASLQARPGLENLPLETWLRMLGTRNLDVLPALCALVEKHVQPARLTVEQCVALACSPAAPVAQLGFSWVQQRPVHNATQLSAVLPLTGARVARVRKDASEWLLDQLESIPDATATQLRDMLDAAFPEPRAAAMGSLGDGRFKDAPELWVALLESPYDDARAFLARHLKERANILPQDGVLRLCATVLLNVHTGSTVKRAALLELVHRLQKTDAHVDTLLLTLRVALRSVRPAEQRAALAALARAVWAAPHLRAFVAVSLPEVKLFPEEAA